MRGVSSSLKKKRQPVSGTSMGKRAKRERDRRRRLAPSPFDPTPPPFAPNPPPRPGSPSVCFANWLGHYGTILVLFETPSGFALIHYDGVKLFRPEASKHIWSEFVNKDTAPHAVSLKEFQVFEDKANAINSNGVCSKLANMIKRSLRPGQKLAVGKQEYKDIIEASLRIHCLFDEAVLEVIWGLKNLIKFFVPGEELELTHEDRLQISRGMKMVLDRYGIEVDASLVNSGIIDMASTVYECDLFVDERAELLQYGSDQIKVVSRIETGLWDKLELATALKLICYPEDEIVTGFSDKMLTKFVAEKLVADAHLYELKRHDWIYMDLYTDFVWVSGTRIVGFHGQGGKTRFEVAPGVHLQGGRTRFGAPALTAVHGRKIEGAPGV